MTEITSWIVPITQSLIAALIMVGIGELWGYAKSKRESIQSMAGVASKAGKRIMPTIIRVALNVFVMWYFIGQIRLLVQDPAPPARMDMFLIAFWTCWAILYYVWAILRPSLRRGSEELAPK